MNFFSHGQDWTESKLILFKAISREEKSAHLEKTLPGFAKRDMNSHL